MKIHTMAILIATLFLSACGSKQSDDKSNNFMESEALKNGTTADGPDNDTYPKYSDLSTLSIESINVQEFDYDSGSFNVDPNPAMYFFNPYKDFLLFVKLKGLPEKNYDIKELEVTITSDGKVRQLKNSSSIQTNAQGVTHIPFYLGESYIYCNASNMITVSLPGKSKSIKGELGVECGE